VDKARAILRKAALWDIVAAPLPTSTDASGTQTPVSSSITEKDDAKQLDAADALLLMISDEILGRLTNAKKLHRQKMWHRLQQMLRPARIQQYITLQREYQSLHHDPDTETLDEFLDREKTLQDEMLATGVTVTDDLRLVICPTSSMSSKYATTIQL
jgi:hypothetical protein